MALNLESRNTNLWSTGSELGVVEAPIWRDKFAVL